MSTKAPITDLEKATDEVPQDKYWVVYYLLLMLGLVHIIPWRFFETASEYWMYKFRNISIDQSTDPDYRTRLQVEFNPAVTGTLEITTIVFYCLGLFYGHKFKIHLRLYASFSLILTLFVVSTLFIFIDSDQWQGLFFGFTMIVVMLMSAVNAVLGLIIMELSAYFPPMYLGAYITGVGLANVFTAALEVISLAIGISTTASALVYFWSATVFIAVIGTVLVLVVNRNAFYNHYIQNSKVLPLEMMSLRRFWYIFCKVWPGGAIQLLYVVSTTSVHSAITVLVVSEDAGSGLWNDTYFVPFVSFFVFAFMDYVGRVLGVKLTKHPGAYALVALSVLKLVVFVPLILLCNAQPRHHLPVLFPHDYQYIVIIACFGLSTGYLCAFVHRIIPSLVPLDELKEGLQVNIFVSAICLGTFAFLPFVTVDII